VARPVRAVLRRQRNFEFRMTEVTGLDADGKRLVTTDGPIGYDYLILAVGGETNYFGLEGVVRHGFGLKDIPEAIRIRNHVLHAFERAMLEADPERRRAELTFVVVGGGPTGVEMAGALSELIRLVLVKDYPRLNVKDVRVLLLEATDRLLAAMPAKLRDAAAETLWRKHVEVRFGATVADYDGARVLLKSGEVIPPCTLIWAAGVQALSLTGRLGRPAPQRGRSPAAYAGVPSALATPASSQPGQEAGEAAIPQPHHLDGTVGTRGPAREQQVDHRSDARDAHRHGHGQDPHAQNTVSMIVSGRPA